MDVQHHLALDAQVEVEDQAVDDVADRPLDGVLEGDEAQVDLASPHRVEHVDQRTQRGDLGRPVVGLAEQRLLGEGSLRAEEPDAQRRTVDGVWRCVRGHTQAG